jgi:HAD superfamily hydrolase (TIGR01509 family)
VSIDYSRVTTLLCDADGNLFPSEEPAYDASVLVTNDFLAEHGIAERVDPVELRRTCTGMNFRATACALLARHDKTADAADLERWVAVEREQVTRHLAATLRPDPQVLEPLGALDRHYLLASVSSSALARLAGCFTVTGLDALLPAERRFSAEDSLAVATSKPDPAIYEHACAALGVAPLDALAVEDSVPGVRSAVAAGVPTVGNVQFVPAAERPERIQQLRHAGAGDIVESWAELERRMAASRSLVAPTP